MGSLSSGPEAIDDFILIKSDGFPTYNFAHIVDDFEMKITHVIRGQEFLSSTPNYLNLYEALGIERPVLALAPPILSPDGNRKLSKRDEAKDVMDYIRQGFLPDVLLNFIVSLGWNDGTEQEVFSRGELIKKFSLERVQKGGARFDERRLQWMSGVYIREQIGLEDLYSYVSGENFFKKNYWPPEAESYGREYRLSVLELVKERLKYFDELAGLTDFFFKDLPLDPGLISGHKQLKKLDSSQQYDLLSQVKASLADSDFSVPELTDRLNALLQSAGQKPTVLFSLVRIAATQAPASPALAETLAVLGKKRSLERIDTQLKALA
jgi:glutamyl-tRNA synthetase